MKYAKMFVIVALAAAVVLAFAAAALATTLTSPSGTAYTGTVEAESGEITLHGVATASCESSKVKGTVESHGSGVTVVDVIGLWAFSGCINHWTIKAAGVWRFHASSSGAWTSSGLALVIVYTSLGLTCEYTTNETQLGTFTSGSPAKLDVEASLPRTGGSIFCGSSGELTGSYTITNPNTLSLDS